MDLKAVLWTAPGCQWINNHNKLNYGQSSWLLAVAAAAAARDSQWIIHVGDCGGPEYNATEMTSHPIPSTI
jgi:hypothetical protein